MGVADNKTYKDQWPYFSKFRSIPSGNMTQNDLPSLNVDPKINSTIKENPEKSNVEIEGGEIVLQPDLSALFKAVGKKHKRGGMDVMLRPNSFVYSDDKSLGFSQRDHELFELKEGGYTPAQVLKKNIDVKHYNTLINNMSDPKKDDLAKKSSALMLSKYLKTLGNIAYKQEEIKEFPDGIPDFALGTAPVYNADTKNKIMESKQYSKYGGKIQAQTGGFPLPWQNPSSTPLGPYFPKKKKDIKIEDILPFLNPKQQAPQSTDNINNGQLGQEMWDKIVGSIVQNTSPLDRKATGPMTLGSQRVSGVPSKVSGVSPINPREMRAAKPISGEKMPLGVGPIDALLPKNGTAGISPEMLKTEQGAPLRADWEFTPWQKLSQGYNWLNFANVKRYMPYRSNYDATYVDPMLVNPEQSINDVRSSGNQQINSLKSLNPILRNAQASSAYGQMLNTIPGIRSQYDNQNAQITNQSRMYNNQVKNDETMRNLGFDQQYYQQAVVGRQNFDNMRTYTANNAMNNVMRDVETNQKLAYNLLTQNTPAYGFDWKTGNFTRNPKNILDVQGIDPKQSWESMVNEIQDLKRSGLSDQVLSAIVRGRFFQQAAPFFQGANTPPPFAYGKGGKYRGKK